MNIYLNCEVTILYFGAYQSAYPRNVMNILGMRLSGYKVIECNVKKMKFNTENRYLYFFFFFFYPAFFVYRTLNLLCRGLFLYFKQGYDIIIVGHPGQMDVPIASILSKLLRKPLVLEGLISIYDTYVNDRKSIEPESVIAKLIYKIEKFAYQLCDLIIVDTNQNKRFISNFFDVPLKKLVVVYVGADDRIYRPLRVKKNSRNYLFNVYFFGNYIPLHGIEHIIESARILRKRKNIMFYLIGNGQTLPIIKELAKSYSLSNVKFLPPVPENKLPGVLSNADVILGIFQNNDKASRVIPNKVYQGIAIKKPIITSRTPAIKEVFFDKDNILLCNPADPKDLAEKILNMKLDSKLRNKIKVNAYNLYRTSYTPQVLGNSLNKQILSLLS